jgi:hypothetical protein
LGLRHEGWAWLELGVGCTSGIAIDRMVRRSFDFWRAKGEADAE